MRTSFIPLVRNTLWVATGLFFTGAVLGDVITTKDGARLVGHVKQITRNEVQLVTGYAGTISIGTAHIEHLETDDPLTARFQDGSLLTGVARIEAAGDAAPQLVVDGSAGPSRIDFGQMLAAWEPDTEPPAESGIGPAYQWHYSVGFDVAGKEGNTDEFTTNLVGEAVRLRDDKEWRVHGSYERGEQDGVENANELIGGASYTSFFTKTLGWYVRGEAERDDFEDIDLRLTTAGGLNWRVIDTGQHALQLLGGAGYRHESFQNDSSDGAVMLDLGLKHRLTLRTWLVMTNTLTYTPQFEDFSDYLLVHDSALELPVGTGPWTLRLGIRNDYKSEPATGRKKLDTAHYSRLMMRF